MRKWPPSWALLVLLAGPAACASSRSYDASSRSYEMVHAAPGAMPAPTAQSVGYITASDAPSSASYEGAPERVSSAQLASAKNPPPGPAPASTAPPPASTAPAPASTAPPGQSPSQGSGQVSAVRAPILIYTAELIMAVFEVNASLARVEELARELGGFLARRDDSAITIRVPAARFDEALKRIEGFGDVLHRNVHTEDVTEEFLDIEIRLRNARAVRDRLEKLLEKAVKIEESIQLERELARVAGEIERMEGRLKYLRDRAAFSTLTVRFRPHSPEGPAPKEPRLPIGWLNELGLSRLLNL